MNKRMQHPICKRTAALALVAALIIASLSFSYAESTGGENPQASFLSSAGIFVGSGGDLMLEQTFPIEQLLVVISRLTGKEAEAKAYAGTSTFSDVPAGHWAVPYIAWAKAGGIVKGNTDGTLGLGKACTTQRLLAFTLRAMGYDVAWNDVMGFARAKGLLDDVSPHADASPARGVVAVILYDALQVETARGKLLGVELGVIDDPALALTPAEISKKDSGSIVYIETYDEEGYVLATASGIVVGGDGRIATNFHAIDGAVSAEVTLIDGRVLPVVFVLTYDIQRDLAVLKVDATDLVPVTLGNSDLVANGEEIVTIGSPIGLQNSISEGLVSNRSREVDGLPYIQISAPISEGSSGGALFNRFGDVIGMTSASYDDGQNLNLAIPVNGLTQLMKTQNAVTLAALHTMPIEQTLYYDYGVFTGRTVGGLPNGEGTLVYSNGDVYEGNFVDGYAKGYGEYVWNEDGTMWKGEWEDDLMNGAGQYWYTEKDFVSGVWEWNAYMSDIAVPKGLKLRAASSTSIEIGWDKSDDAAYYHVYYSDAPNGEWSWFQDSEGYVGDMLWEDGYACTLTDCTPGSTMYFKITGVVWDKESEESQIVSVTLPKE